MEAVTHQWNKTASWTRLSESMFVSPSDNIPEKHELCLSFTPHELESGFVAFEHRPSDKIKNSLKSLHNQNNVSHNAMHKGNTEEQLQHIG